MKTQPTDHLTQDGLSGTAGELQCDQISITFGGACPVQGYGLIRPAEGGEFPCYYRARGSSWQFEVYEPGMDLEADGLDGDRTLFELGQTCYAWPDAGWLGAHESIANIRRGVDGFLDRNAQGVRYQAYEGASSVRTLEKSQLQEPDRRDPEVEQRLADLRWRMVGIDLGKLLQDGARVALDLHGPDLAGSDWASRLTAAMVAGIGYGLRGDPRPTVDVPAELEALAKLAGMALVCPEPSD